MSEHSFMKGTPLSFKSNTHATMAFNSREDLQKFAEKTSARVASMLHVLMEVHQEVDGGFMTDMLEVANDMAYQVQQAVELMETKPAVEVANE